MDSTLTTRRPCFIEEDDGLASLAEMEAGFSGSNNQNTTQINYNQHNHFISRPVYYSRKASLKKFSYLANTSPRFEEHQPHFLDSCFLCKKPLGDNKDIFMYRGDTPFCSEECRQEQIETDEAKEKNWNLKALRNKSDQKKSTNSPSKKAYGYRTGAVAAA